MEVIKFFNVGFIVCALIALFVTIYHQSSSVIAQSLWIGSSMIWCINEGWLK